MATVIGNFVGLWITSAGMVHIVSYHHYYWYKQYTLPESSRPWLQGWIQHDLVGVGGGEGRGGGCSASSGAEMCRSCVPPAHQLASLLKSLA